MYQLPDNNTDVNGNPIRTTPGTTAGAGREIGYEPFGQNYNTTTGTMVGGGGGSYTPPVQPNPTFIPPSFSNDGEIKIILSSTEDAQFTENDVNVGIGNSITLNKTTLTFGSDKIYKAVKNSVRTKNYFIVSIQKKFNTIKDVIANQSNLVPGLLPTNTLSTAKTNSFVPDNENGLTFGYNMGNPIGINDYLYAENISVKEFEYNESAKDYIFLRELYVEKNKGIVNLEFSFIPEIVLEPNQTIDYSVEFISNYSSDLENILSLKYQIVSKDGLSIDTDTISLGDGSTDDKNIDTSFLKDSKVNFEIIGNLPAGYIYKNIFYKSKEASSYIKNDGVVGWKEVTQTFSIPGNELKNGITVNVVLEKVAIGLKPQLNLSSNQITKQVKESDKDAIVNIQFNYSNTDIINVYLPDGTKFRVKAYQGFAPISFAKNFKNVYGTKKILLVPYSDAYGDGDRYEVLVNFVSVNDFPSVTQIIFPTEVEVPSFSDGNLEWDITYSTKAVSSVDVDLLLKDNSRVSLYKNLPAKSTFKVNIRDLPTKFPLWNGNQNLTLVLKPYNRSGEEELVGNDYQISTAILYPSVKLDEDIIRKSIYDAFTEHLNFTEPEPESKYLTHLINLGNDDRVLVSSWEEDNWTLSEKGEDELGNQIVTNEVKSVILKLYEPLPPEVGVNSRIWITKLMTNPLIETIVLNEDSKDEYAFISGPNFDVDIDFVKGQSTNYQSLDELIISASNSTQLIQTYLSGSTTSMDDLNIQYVAIKSNVPEAPTFIEASIEYFDGNTSYYTGGILGVPAILNHNYRVYSYFETESGRVLSNTYTTFSSDISNDGNLKDYVINVSWNTVVGADGYLVVKYNPDNWYWDAGVYVIDNNFTDENVSTFSTIDNIGQNEFNGNYLWENFVHFSSAEERVKNFVYKVQLIENYEILIASASIGAQTGSLSTQQELQRLNSKKSGLIQGFDGFETFLYTPSEYSTAYSSSITWPHSSGIRIASTEQVVADWYENVTDRARYYDNNNPNWLINNIPQYILTNPENENFLLFFSMIGHHFDTIYFYTKAIERSRNITYQSENGVANKLLYDSIKSFGWDPKNLGSDKELWNYVFGEDKNGNVKEADPSKNRTSEVWRRVINNLPYLLKHKGTRRGIYALMACYGIPSSNLSIMEFGGPEVTDDSKNKLEIDNSSYTFSATISDQINLTTVTNQKTFEIFLKPAQSGQYNIFSDSTLKISGSADSEYGKVYWNGNWSDNLPIFNGRFFGICISNTNLYIAQNEGDRYIFSYSASGVTAWSTGKIINGFTGSIDEIRMWNTGLSQSAFLEHVMYPEMINGNHISASTTDLDLRLDFEYPKPVGTGGYNWLLNVAPGIRYTDPKKSRNYYEVNTSTTGMSRLRTTMPYKIFTTSGAITNYPYNFEPINRNSILEMPDIGVSRYASNKIRVEEQALVSDLSSKHRSTKKAFDNQPIDSNRVGLFFSPNKELNLDIAKSLGDINLNEYIGDPSDRFKPAYKSLDSVREYYFQRIQNRDIYSYINLIRAYEKAMFEDIKKMLPARVTATTGILIEPHFLERSKYQYTKPTGSNDYSEGVTEYTSQIISENNQFDALVNADLGEEIFGENEQYESIVNADLSENLLAENIQYDTTIGANDEINTSGDYYTYESNIDARFDLPTRTSQAPIEDTNLLTANTFYQDVGFSVYAQNGTAIWSYYDVDGSLKKERVRVTLVKEQKVKVFDKYNVVINGVGDDRGGFSTTSSFYTETNLLVQPFSGSIMPQSGSGSIISATPVDGYLPTHHKYTTDLTTGMQNSYYKGSKNTSATTLDGTDPVEIFVTNPNTIKVIGNETSGRDVNEPIIQVD